jgi:hypothetical protein
MQNWKLFSEMRRFAILAGFVAMQVWSGQASAEVRYSDVAGYSVQIAWTDSPTYRTKDGREATKGRTIRKTLYLGARNHIFERTVVDQNKGGLNLGMGPGGQSHGAGLRASWRGDTRKHEEVAGLGETGPELQWAFKDGALIKMLRLREGAQRLTIALTAEGGSFGCSLTVQDLRENGVGRVVDDSGIVQEVVSRTVSVQSCKVEKGNLISGDQ